MMKHPRILLVEDNPADVVLVEEALRAARVEARLDKARDGGEAIAMLDESRPSDAPQLILLDLNLPGMSGTEVLRHVKGDERLAAIPVVVVSSSDAADDVQRAYALHTNSYLTKPLEADQFFRAVEQLCTYWFDLCRLPSEHGS